MKPDTASPGADAAVRTQTVSESRIMRWLLTGIFIILAVYALYFGKDFFMPVILAFLLALTLTPIVRFLRKRGVPDAASATLLVLLSLAAAGSAGYFLSGPVIDLVNNAPSIGQQLTERLAPLRRPFEKLSHISHKMPLAA